MNPQATSTQLHNAASQIDVLVGGLSKLTSAQTAAQTLPINISINNVAYAINDKTTQTLIEQGIANQSGPIKTAYEDLIKNLIVFLQAEAATF